MDPSRKLLLCRLEIWILGGVGHVENMLTTTWQTQDEPKVAEVLSGEYVKFERFAKTFKKHVGRLLNSSVFDKLHYLSTN